MNYYLTHMEYYLDGLDGSYKITQLVKASAPENASRAVKKAATKDQGAKVIILSIRVDDLIIGD